METTIVYWVYIEIKTRMETATEDVGSMEFGWIWRVKGSVRCVSRCFIGFSMRIILCLCHPSM